MPDAPLDAIDIVSLTVWADEQRIHATFARLCREDPVHWTEPLHRPFWPVTRHADIIEVEWPHERFSNAPRLTVMPIAWEEKVKAMTGGNRHILCMLVDTGEGAHGAARALSELLPRLDFMERAGPAGRLAAISSAASRVSRSATRFIDAERLPCRC